MVGKVEVVARSRMKRQLREAVAWCSNEFGMVVADHFYEAVSHSLELLETFPFIGQVEPLLEDEPILYRSLVVHPLYKLIYYVEEPMLYAVALWDTRRDPERMRQEIEDDDEME